MGIIEVKRIIDSKVWKTGNSLVVTLPREFCARWRIREGTNLEITVKKFKMAKVEQHKEYIAR